MSRMPSKSGKMFIDKPDILDEIVDSSIHSSRGGYSVESRRHSKNNEALMKARAKTAEETQRKLLLEQFRLQSQKTDAITKSNVQKAIRNNAEMKEKNFQKLVDDVEDAKDSLRTVDRSLELQDEANRNKIRRQFEDWNNTVHGKIQGNIINQINNIDYKDLNRKRNEDFEKYLNVTNRKAAIFRDIIIESEYDPLEPNRRAIKANTGKIKDPTKLIQQKYEEEASMLGSDELANKSKLKGRYTLPVKHWASGKIEATPHGRFSKMMGEVPVTRTVEEDDFRASLAKSSVFFDDYKFPIGKQVMDAEMPRGKRVFPPNVASDMIGVFEHR